MYYAACFLHLHYKNYCANSWRNKPNWLRQNEAALQLLWASNRTGHCCLIYRVQKVSRTSSLRDSIAALVNVEPSNK
jgi:hypothetical protein